VVIEVLDSLAINPRDLVVAVFLQFVQISTNAARKHTTANKAVSIPEEGLGVPAIRDIS
jgi:hypothetical protein